MAAKNEVDSMVCFQRQTLSWWGRLLMQIVKLGPIPRHVAFVMDGNRRFARSRNCASVLDGHSAGFEQLIRVLDWCDRLGIEEVTVYAFSIENFKRSAEEVQGLMAMFEQKFTQLLERRDELVKNHVGIRFFGNRSWLSANICELMTKIEAESANTTPKTFLNICMAYTSQDEMTRAFEQIRSDVGAGKLDENKIDAELISAYMDTRECRPLDLLIRTSERRLSDFLLWQLQCSPRCLVHFEPDVLWPRFALHHLLRAVVRYQMAQLHAERWQLAAWAGG